MFRCAGLENEFIQLSTVSFFQITVNLSNEFIFKTGPRGKNTPVLGQK